MGTYQVEASTIIAAPPERVYRIIADYRRGHPAILPPRYFTEMEVIEGGYGAGTVITVRMNVFGTEVTYQMTVSEPEPGRILQEEDASAGVATTFTVDPVDDGGRSRVTISTTAVTAPGLRGWLEKLLNPVITRRIYREELERLAAVGQRSV
jgi:uncharacterized protein YndB with AHSA1/START domain